MFEARIKQIFFLERRGSDLYFDVLHVQIFTLNITITIYDIHVHKNAGGGWQLFSKTLVGKELTMEDKNSDFSSFW